MQYVQEEVGVAPKGLLARIAVVKRGQSQCGKDHRHCCRGFRLLAGYPSDPLGKAAGITHPE